MAEIKDFTKRRKELVFKIDDDLFHAVPAIPGELLLKFGTTFTESLSEDASSSDQLRAFQDILALVLMPESLERLNSRLRDVNNPVELDQVGDVITWLFGEYGMRPTETPSPSSPGQASPEPGTTSTASAEAEDSTHLNSMLANSLT